MSYLAASLFTAVLLCAAALVCLAVYLRSRRCSAVAFFHPNCLAGGGGERVLWAAVLALARDCGPIAILFDGSACEGSVHAAASARLSAQFGIARLPDGIRFVDVGPAAFLRPGRFPRFTLLFQAVSSMVYALKCLFKIAPAVLIDTTGAPFAAPVWKLFGGCRVVLYAHYPFISTDMVADVRGRRRSVNNRGSVADSGALTRVKLFYYRVLCFFYGLSGRFVDVCCANSAWTRAHIHQIYGRDPALVYPPCGPASPAPPSSEERDPNLIISVGQYRPEKDHGLQLDVMALLKRTRPDARLAIVGGVRGQADQAIVDALQARIDSEKLSVALQTNLPFADLQMLYAKASVGLHTMRDEHFGICVVEYIAAGLVPVAHNSAGPKEDIVRQSRFLAESAAEYADKVQAALDLAGEEREAIVRGLQGKIARFSDSAFEEAFRNAVLSGNRLL
jgi:alpha-1,2-mannosyltransferase